jgi:hypothetical protein
MRTLRLARVAAEAEGLRIRLMLQRTVRQAVLGIVALVLLILALGFAHIAIWYALRLGAGWTPPVTGAVMCGGDLVLAGILGAFAARSRPGTAEREALTVRRHALTTATGSALRSDLLTRVLLLAFEVMRQRWKP